MDIDGWIDNVEHYPKPASEDEDMLGFDKGEKSERMEKEFRDKGADRGIVRRERDNNDRSHSRDQETGQRYDSREKRSERDQPRYSNDPIQANRTLSRRTDASKLEPDDDVPRSRSSYRDISARGRRNESPGYSLYDDFQALKISFLKMQEEVQLLRQACSDKYVLEWKIRDVSRHRKQCKNGDDIFSPKFCCFAIGGYCFQIRLFWNGRTADNAGNLSLYISPVAGPYDNELSWPFEHKCTVCVVDQSAPIGSFYNVNSSSHSKNTHTITNSTNVNKNNNNNNNTIHDHTTFNESLEEKQEENIEVNKNKQQQQQQQTTQKTNDDSDKINNNTSIENEILGTDDDEDAIYENISNILDVPQNSGLDDFRDLNSPNKKKKLKSSQSTPMSKGIDGQVKNKQKSLYHKTRKLHSLSVRKFWEQLGRPAPGSNLKGWGWGSFMSHEQLDDPQKSFVLNNTLIVRITVSSELLPVS